ncbi:MAG: polysaccharide biosynthesis tyrosine autokinase [Planctomycetota bacterium]
MTSVPATQRSIPGGRPQARPAPAAAGASGAGAAPTVDPIKLLKKYIWVLIGAGVFGVFLGVAVFLVWVRVSPAFSSRVTFQANPPTADVGRVAIEQQADERELQRFMATQTALLKSEALLERVVRDPRLATDAQAWARQYQAANGLFSEQDALRDLQSMVSARVAEGTSLFTLSVTWKSKEDVQGLAGLIRELYMRDVDRRQNEASDRQEEALLAQIRSYEREVDEYTQRRTQLIRSKGIESETQGQDDASLALREITTRINELQGELIATREELKSLEQIQVTVEENLARPDAVNLPAELFPDQFAATVDTQPLVARLRADIETLETSLATLRLEGMKPSHRQYKLTQADLEARRSKMTQLKQSEAIRLLEATIDGLKKAENTIVAQIADLNEQRQTTREELTVLTSDFEELDQLNQRIESLDTTLQGARSQYQTLIASNQASQRVVVIQAERLPEFRDSPSLPITVAGVFVLVVGAAAGLVFLREVLDQRVKGPSDISLIPRAKVLGYVPLAAEDPTNPKHFETIFRDQPRGVLAESIRQFRTTTLRAMQRAGHRSIMFFAAAPRSGASSLVTNFAFAAARVEQKVLIIDANLRRPSVHRSLGLEQGPGVSDVLAGTTEFENAVQSTDEPNLYVLSAGSREHRVFERLGTRAMAALLEKAKQDYDLVILDVAPAVVAGDAASLSTQVDASVMVVRAYSEKRGMVARLQREMSESHADLLGIVINGVRAAAGGYMKRNIRTAHEYQDEIERTPEPAEKPESSKKNKKKAKNAGSSEGDEARTD